MAYIRDLFNVSTNNLDHCTEGILSKCVDDHKLGGMVNTVKGRAATERNTGRLEKCNDKNLKVQQKQTQSFIQNVQTPCNNVAGD